MIHQDDETIKKFLLGCLPRAEAEAMEVAIATNVSRFERLRDVECELVDDYLSNRLSTADAERFENDFLITESRILRFRIAQELRKESGRVSDSVLPSVRRFRYAAAAGSGLLALIVGGSFFLLRGPAQMDENAVAVVREEPLPTNPILVDRPSPLEASPEPRPSTAAISPTSPVKPAATRAPIVAAAVPNFNVRLLPGALRGDREQLVTIPPGAKTVTIYLRPSEPFTGIGRFNAIIRTPENEVIWSFSELSSPRFTIDAAKLGNRTYTISLDGENENNELESLADYTFRVRR